MTQNVLTISFSFRGVVDLSAPVSNLRNDTIIRDLKAHGFDFIDLVDLPGKYTDLCKATDHGVTLWVDHDAKYLVESYCALEKLLEGGKTGRHYSFLNDGVLEITGIIADSEVQLEITRCPGLNVAFRSIHTTTVSLVDYISVWRQMASILQSYQ